MKKLLSVSIVAMLAVSPMMAHADPVALDPQNSHGPTANANGPVAGADAPFAAETIYDTDATGVASAAYVKGAYNASIRAINKVNSTVTGLSTNLDSTIKSKINSAAGEGLKTTADGVLAVDSSVYTVQAVNTAAGTGLTNSGGTIDLTEDVKSSLAKADSALQSGNVNSGLAWDSTNSKLNLNVDDSTLAVDSNTNKVGVVAHSIGSDQLSTAVNSSLANANSALQSSNAGTGIVWDSTNSELDVNVDGTTLAVDSSTNKVGVVAHSIGSDQLSTAVNTDLGLARSALQAADIADMATRNGVLNTINSSTASVSGTVPVFAAWGDTSAGTITVNATGSVSAPAQYQGQ